jgi:hypothetical protein
MARLATTSGGRWPKGGQLREASWGRGRTGSIGYLGGDGSRAQLMGHQTEEESPGQGTTLLRRLGLALILLCLIQFLLGMELNLLVSIPRRHPGSSGPDYLVRAYQSVLWGLSHGVVLASHAGLGISILLLSLWLALAAFRAPDRRLRWVSALGFLAVLAAGWGGAFFLSYDQNLSSMIMAVGFAVAVLCFSWVIFRAGAVAPREAVPGA